MSSELRANGGERCCGGCCRCGRRGCARGMRQSPATAVLAPWNLTFSADESTVSFASQAMPQKYGGIPETFASLRPEQREASLEFPQLKKLLEDLQIWDETTCDVRLMTSSSPIETAAPVFAS
ncbi:unnamed protein product [Effrenium voratum]|nr:unnamed protein product [Effrenium voratum]